MKAGYVKLPGHGLVRWVLTSGALIVGRHEWQTFPMGPNTWRIERNRRSLCVRLEGDVLTHITAAEALAPVSAPPPSGPRLAPKLPLYRKPRTEQAR